jgi:hypothetical protein
MDLPASQQAVQACHASIEAARFIDSNETHPHLVLCGISSESQLENAMCKAQAAGIRCFPFNEPDIGGQLTAFATEPLSEETRRHFRRYNLLCL